MKYLVMLCIAVTAPACRHAPVCTPGHTACDGQFVVMCNANGQFEPRMDCAAISEMSGRMYSCQLVDSPGDEDWEGADGYTCEIERDAVAQ